MTLIIIKIILFFYLKINYYLNIIMENLDKIKELGEKVSSKECKMRNIADPLKISTININNYKRTIIMGDIHGCYDELINLLNKVNYDSNNDLLISVGDLIAKGPKSLEVLNFFINNKNTLCVMGNHEYAVVRWLFFAESNESNKSIPIGLKPGSEHEKMAKMLNSEQIKYLYNLPHILQISTKFDIDEKKTKNNLIIVHAGINPLIDISQNNSYDVMYVRNIHNSLATEYISNGTNWTELWKGEETIIFGHDAIRGIQIKNNSIGLDSACVYGKQLSCIIYPNKEIVSVPALNMYVVPNESALFKE